MGLTKLISSVFKSNVGFSSYTRVLGRSCSTNVHFDDTVSGEDKKPDVSKKGLVVGVYENDGKLELSPAAEEADAASGGKITEQLNVFSERLKLGKAFVLTNVPDYAAVAVASYGRKDAGFDQLEQIDLTKENVRWGVGAGVRKLQHRGVGDISVDPGDASDAAGEAAELASWRFQEFRTEGRESLPKVSPQGDKGSWEEGAGRGRAQNWARYLSDMPANKMAPVDFAQAALDMLCPLGVQVTARDRDWIEAQKMDAFLTVAKGSCETPIFLECHYNGGGNDAPVLLAAKGVTFDSGGLCLKKAHSMSENRGSMAGAAAALGALKVVAEQKAPINIRCVIPLCENLVSGQCMKVGDVVRALNGLSIVIENTDMEGRLMLADALVFGQANYRPRLVIDVATLTHGILLATGGGAFGCFSNSEAAWKAARAAGATTGDRPWRFPLWNFYHKQISDDPAVDLRNQGSGKASPCLGAAFLKNFICTKWLHMDITGVGKLAHAPAPPYLDARRMTGRPTRTLAALLLQLAGDCAEKGEGKS